MPSVLDRANLQQVPELDGASPDHLQPTLSAVLKQKEEDPKSAPSRLRRYKTSTKRWTAKTRAVLHFRVSAETDAEIEQDVPTHAPTLAQLPPPTSETDRLDGELPPGPGEKFKDFVRNPIDTITSAVQSQGGQAIASNLVSKEINHAQDVQLVQAHEELLEAETEEQKEEAQETMDELKKSRQDLFVRWALDRHVLKIRKLEPKIIPHLQRSDFVEVDAWGKRRTDWASYCQHVLKRFSEQHASHYIGAYSEPPPASQQTLTAGCERLIVATAPLQQTLMMMRRVYRWENPRLTSFYLASFLCLWAWDLLTLAALVAVIVRVLQRRQHVASIGELRDELVRVEDADEDALNITELIEKHGTEGWTDSLIESMGPRLLIQMNDTASIMEEFLSFFEWREPKRTTYVLCILTIWCLAVFLTPTWLLVKSTTFFAGFSFFVLFPVSSRYPEYRFLVSPLKWLLWNIPTHPEYAIDRLQWEGSHHKEEAIRKSMENHKESEKHHTIDSTSTIPEEVDLLKFQATHLSKLGLSHQGKLIVSTSSVRFETAIRGKEQWRVTYDNLYRLEKVNFSMKLRSGDDLLFTDSEGGTFRADDLMERDSIFNQIVGYSGITWQIVG